MTFQIPDKNHIFVDHELKEAFHPKYTFLITMTHRAWRRRAVCGREGPGAPWSSSPTLPRSSCSSSHSPWGWSGSPWWRWPCSLAHWGEISDSMSKWCVLISDTKYRSRGSVGEFQCVCVCVWHGWCNSLREILISQCVMRITSLVTGLTHHTHHHASALYASQDIFNNVFPNRCNTKNKYLFNHKSFYM